MSKLIFNSHLTPFHHSVHVARYDQIFPFYLTAKRNCKTHQILNFCCGNPVILRPSLAWRITRFISSFTQRASQNKRLLLSVSVVISFRWLNLQYFTVLYRGEVTSVTKSFVRKHIEKICVSQYNIKIILNVASRMGRILLAVGGVQCCVIGNEPMTCTKCRNSVNYSSNSQLHAINCDILFRFRTNSPAKNTDNCSYQEREGKIILTNTTNEHVIGAELPGNFRRIFLAVALKHVTSQWKDA